MAGMRENTRRIRMAVLCFVPINDAKWLPALREAMKNGFLVGFVSASL